MHTFGLKVPEEELDKHLKKKIRAISIKELEVPHRKSYGAKEYDNRPNAGYKGATYKSNMTHIRFTDSDASMNVKPGKIIKLTYFSQLSVDTTLNVIADIRSYHVDDKDN